ncbi:MAG: diguanylate cyclase domain-containing protein [Rhodanobacteraceae bacterium]
MSSSKVSILPRHPLESTVRARLDHVLDMLVDAVCIVDPDGHFVYASAACERIFGYKPGELIGRQMMELIHPEDRVRTTDAVKTIMGGTPLPHFENRYIRKDGSVVHVMWAARWSDQDGVRIAVARDVTELKRSAAVQNALLAISEAAHAATDLGDLFRHIHTIIGNLLPAKNFFVALYDKESEAISFPYFVDEHDSTPPKLSLDSGSLTGQIIRSGEALLLTPEAAQAIPPKVGMVMGRKALDWLGVPLATHERTIGALVVQSYSGETRYTAEDKQLLQFVSAQVATAIERKQTETRLRHIAQHDALTDLPNRKLFGERLQAALAHASGKNETPALLYIDLDHFKCINDTLGHDVGDRLLQEVAERINGCVGGSSTVARMGGDEFVVLLTGLTKPRQAAIVAEKILASLYWPFETLEGPMAITASIGISLYHGRGDAQQLLREADNAMYAAKKAGGNRCWSVG